MRSLALAMALLAACSDEGGGFTRVPARGFFQPEALDFGERAIGLASPAEVVLTNSSAETLLFDRVMFEGADGSAFAARTQDGSTLRGAQLAPSARLTIEVLFGPSEERAYAAKMVVFSKELGIELAVTGTGRLIPPATPGFSPTAIAFGSSIEIGRKVVKPLRLTNVGDVTGHLTAIAVAAPFSVTAAGGAPATPSIDLIPGDGIDLEVSFQPAAVGPASAAIRFDMDGGGSATLPANGSAIRAAALACDTSAIDFGPLVRGDSARRTVTCSADGPFTFAAIDVPLGGSAFTPENVSPAIGSSATDWTFEAVFRASGIAGMRSGRFEIVGGTGARVPITASGEVTGPLPGDTDLRIALSWIAIDTDFDLHLVRAGQLPFDSDNDCHYAAKTLDWGTPSDASDDPFLDRDDIHGPGTEELNLAVAHDGFYDAYVMYFDDASYAGAADLTVAYNLEGGATQMVTHAMSTCGNTWHVGRFDFGVSPATFTPDGGETAQWSTRTDECR